MPANKKNSYLDYFLLSLGFFNGFFSPYGLIAYIIGFKTLAKRYNRFDIFLIIIFLFLLMVTIFYCYQNLYYGLNAFRFFFGFMLFYFAFNSNYEINFNNLFKFLFIIIFIEAILVNNFINAWELPNYPELVNGKLSSHYAYENFNYQRPYSFAAMANVTSPLIVAIFALSNYDRFIHYLFLLTIVTIIMSGTGFIALGLLLFLRRKIFFIILMFMFLFLFSLVLGSGFSELLSARVSPESIVKLLFLKINQISLNSDLVTGSIIGLQNIFSQFSYSNVIFGGLEILSKSNLGYGGDFGWLWLYVSYGFFGIFFYLILILKNINKNNFIPIAIMILATFHYPVIFFLSGQILFAYMLNIKNKRN